MAGDTSNPIQIELTVGELSRILKSDERFGLYIRVWTETGALRDEIEGDDEPVLTVRLTVDATLKPVWELMCDRVETYWTLANPSMYSAMISTFFAAKKITMGETGRHLDQGSQTGSAFSMWVCHRRARLHRQSPSATKARTPYKELCADSIH